jgi:8-oxo-dGTP diphosphatase
MKSPVQTERPKIGMGVLIKKGGKILMGLRQNTSHGNGEWCFPGGHLEFGESFAECILRETKEECGIQIKNLRFHCVANVRKYDRHYVLVGFLADWKRGEPKLLEPDKFVEWRWFDAKNLPRPIFKTTKIMLDALKSKKICIDA